LKQLKKEKNHLKLIKLREERKEIIKQKNVRIIRKKRIEESKQKNNSKYEKLSKEELMLQKN
jgi:hypothetical protein